MTHPSHLQDFDDLVEGWADLMFQTCAALVLVTRILAYAAHAGSHELEIAVWGKNGNS